MNNEKHPLHIAFMLIIFSMLIFYSLFRLHVHMEVESLQNQISKGFYIVYVDASYVISIGNLIVAPIIIVYIVLNYIAKHPRMNIRWVTIAAVFALIIALPGQYWEFGRLQQIARSHGFVECPPFTLASGAKTVDAMALDSEYCMDDEINRLGMNGYYQELDRIDNLLKERKAPNLYN